MSRSVIPGLEAPDVGLETLKMRCSDATTSFTVRSRPSENLTPGRSLKVHVS